MADANLFWELRKRYPEVPDFVVKQYMTQFGNDRERCIEMLTNESPKYLFGNQNCQVNDRLSELNLGEPRPRSDSSSSNMSNASSSSASSRPPFNSSHSLMNVPGYRGPIIGTDDNHPPTAPILPNEINQFMDMYRGDQNTAEIPNISCNNVQSVQPYGNRTFQYGGGYGQNPSGNPVSLSSSQQNLRQIEVQHIQTSREPSVVNQQPNYFQIRIASNHSGLGGHVTQNNPSQPMTPNRGWVQHPVHYNNPYHKVAYTANQNTAFSSDHRSSPISQYNVNHNSAVTSPYRSPVEEQRTFGGYGQQQYESQHSSQAMIYLQNPTASPNTQMNTVPLVERPILSPGGQNNVNVHGSYNDPCSSPNIVRNPSMNDCQPSPQNMSGPVLVEIKTPQRGLGVQSRVQFFNKIAGTSNSNPGGVSPQTVQKNVMLGQYSQSNENPLPESQQHYVNRHYTPERPTVINFQGSGTSRDDGGFLQFPPMPPECRVPGHPHGPIQKSASVDSNSVFVSDMEYRNIPTQPFMSPASSPSSLSSESSAARERPRSGSLQDDPAYLQALLSHQKSRMDKLVEDLRLAEERLAQLKGEVTSLESHVIERKRQKSSVFPSSVDLAKLRGDNLQLQADIQLMTREIDLFNNGQTPLGVLDPLEQQNFYKNMNTGQRGSIYASASQTPPKTFTSTVTTSVTTTVTTPTRPPPEIPPELPPRDPQPRDVPPPLPPRISATQVPPPPPHQQPVNSGDSDADGEQWSCSACTFLNHPALNKCECCEMPRMSMSTSSPLSPRDVPDSYPTTVQNTPSP
ncbi:mitogen-activated protein kinase kinase kinase 7-interacting protein 3 homolog [Mercenaria mercenaria]|uniref:mitogen-activated protein kinase kinase kinase 7-interacting protein 3 homolog n=1 Tax=Mercenaria mercenaria TaxID=6596 RepID=UPI00234F882B|nr:mitogen-activated protein kinase kinase kinase 7-interacting protein 3 homolog [Mercenaria mercenaria]